MIENNLLTKYNVPVPRYTSYPTVPYWQDGIDPALWVEKFISAFSGDGGKDGISLYIHLPFCESLCTYCGCNKKITTNHSVENVYIEAILKEWKMYTALIGKRPILRELHLGGGTPTFFSPENLCSLLQPILLDYNIHEDYDFSIEGHPNNTTEYHLRTLYALGFRRISYGVQDNDPEVQLKINRIQPFENVQRATEAARTIGFTSVNFDLIYGLPCQSLESMQKTLEQTISLRPDRIAFYSYAHVPWTSKAQRLFDEHDLPSPEVKMQLYQLGKQMFTNVGYTDIGMDHFALQHDSLYDAMQKGKLYRNFMGYTTHNSSMLLGLGVSSISDSGTAFAQNCKTLHDYYALIGDNKIPVRKGYFLSEEDVAFRKYILDVSCRGTALFALEHLQLLQQYTFPELTRLAADGLVTFDETGLEVTLKGKNFIRNICRAFDLKLLQAQVPNQTKTFSRAI